MKLNIKIFANMKEYYYTINNSNNKKEENEKNKSLISKFYNSVKKVGQKIQNLFELKVESNNENRNINEQRIYDNIEQINFYDVPSSLYESFTEQNSILNKDLNTFPKKMTREEYKKNPFNKINYFSQKEVKNNFKEEEMIKNKNYYQNLNYSNFIQNYNNLSKEINPFKIENKNYNQNTFKLNKKREAQKIMLKMNILNIFHQIKVLKKKIKFQMLIHFKLKVKRILFDMVLPFCRHHSIG